ncbi:MAG: FHA domain-containing protein [Epsilonproteobacteria bacterium]|nr:FHA domain-containing protein [Campylobacterota bacterium]
MLFDNKSKERIYRTLGSFADALNTMAIKYQLISGATASAFVYYLKEDSHHTSELYFESFYMKLNSMMDIVLKIKEENQAIEKTVFWNTLLNTKQLLNDKALSDKEEFIKMFLDGLEEASTQDIDLKRLVTSSKKLVHKGFVQIGRSSKIEHGNDIVFNDDRTLSRIHLVITVDKGEFHIEDRSANGTFVNGRKIEKGVKHLVTKEDEIRIGREGTLIDLNHQKIQELRKNV